MGTCGSQLDADSDSEIEEEESQSQAPKKTETQAKPPLPEATVPNDPVPKAAPTIQKSESSVNDDVRKQLLAKKKGQKTRTAVLDNNDDEDDEDFVPQTYAKSQEDQDAIRAILMDSFLFKNMRAVQLQGVIDSMIKEEVKAPTLLIREGDPGDKFYIATTGSFEVVIKTFLNGIFNIRTGIAVKVLDSGTSFGELSLMYNQPRSCTIRTKTDATVFSLDRRSFKRYLIQANQAQADIHLKTLKNVKLLQNLGEQVLRQIADALVRRTFEPGEDIITEGEKGDEFFILEDGEVDIYTKKTGFIRTLGPGCTFGEVALQKNVLRTATCRAKSLCNLMAMDRESFETLFGPLDALQEKMKDQHLARVETEGRDPDALTFSKVVPISELELIKDVGRGAFGRVKIVRHTPSKRLFALKVMQKTMIVKTKNTMQVVREKRLLGMVQPHPLIVGLESASQDDNCLYLLQEFINGGDLFHRLYNIEGCFQSNVAQYYACCVTLMLERLHSFDIIYRDLKPENLLITADGVLKLVDFGMAKLIKGRSYTLCGTPEYMAPEMIHSMGHAKGVDYWALGVLIYEMICGSNPFEDATGNHALVYRNIDQGKVVFPQWLNDEDGKKIVKNLLVRNQAKRLGCGIKGADDLKVHPWFSSTDFKGIHDYTVTPPIQPPLTDPLDTSNFYPIEDDGSVMSYTNTGLEYEDVWDKEFPFAI